MNELFWRNETDPLALLDALHPMRTLGSVRPQTRQSRMYLLACARRSWRRLPSVCRTLVTLAEIFAEAPRQKEKLRADLAPIAEQLMHSDGEPDDLKAAEIALAVVEELTDIVREARKEAAVSPAPPAPPLTPDEWRGLAALVFLPFEPGTPAYKWVPQPLHSPRLLREVYGNPCRQFHFDPNWRTDTVLTLARQMYESREFSAMPILADALQDAGCDNGEILVHCRSPGTHVRGCWVLDRVLDLK